MFISLPLILPFPPCPTPAFLFCRWTLACLKFNFNKLQVLFGDISSHQKVPGHPILSCEWDKMTQVAIIPVNSEMSGTYWRAWKSFFITELNLNTSSVRDTYLVLRRTQDPGSRCWMDSPPRNQREEQGGFRFLRNIQERKTKIQSIQYICNIFCY